MLEGVDLLICGAGPVGCVVAQKAAELGWRSLIVEKRRHLAGNCHDSHHPANGVLVHNYGPHYFRTNDKSLLEYLSRFTEWTPGNYEVRSFSGGQHYPFPINLSTLEQFFNRKLDAESAEALLAARRVAGGTPATSEEFVLSRVGKELYEAFYLGYTLKQWDIHPKDLEASVCGRIPIRLNRDGRYVDHKYQVTPKHGFTSLFTKMTDHPNIQVLLNADFRAVQKLVKPRQATVYTGPIDEYFGCKLGRLPYRSLTFDFVPYNVEYKQPCVQINYPNDFTYTRSVEIKHITGQRNPETVVQYETPTASGDPYYPIPVPQNTALYKEYKGLADRERRERQVYFVGRLAQYRYFNTDEVILEAIKCFEDIKAAAQVPPLRAAA